VHVEADRRVDAIRGGDPVPDTLTITDKTRREL
jgi:hypothetical protein